MNSDVKKIETLITILKNMNKYNFNFYENEVIFFSKDYIDPDIGNLLFELKQDLHKIVEKYSQKVFKLMGYYIDKIEKEGEKCVSSDFYGMSESKGNSSE